MLDQHLKKSWKDSLRPTSIAEVLVRTARKGKQESTIAVIATKRED